MRKKNSILKASGVYAKCRRLLTDNLQVKDYKRSVPASLMAGLLLMAAFTHSSLCMACRLHPRAPSYESVRKAMHALLPRSGRTLLDRLRAALRESLPLWLFDAPRVVALDLHHRPFYGRESVKGVVQGQKKASTRKSFAYATLAVISPEGRWTIGLLPVYPAMRLETIVSRLLAQARGIGIRIALLLADKGFDSAGVFDLLRKQEVPFIIPMQKRGKKPGTGNRHLFDAGLEPGWHRYEWDSVTRKWVFAKGEPGKRVVRGKKAAWVDACVARGKGRKDGRETRWVFGCWGLKASWSPGQVRTAYRKRFGIETTYRQLGQCLGGTSSTKECWRLLLVGVGLLLLNVWATLHSEQFSTGPLGERTRRLGRLRLRELLAGMLFFVLAEAPPDWWWQTQKPILQGFESLE